MAKLYRVKTIAERVEYDGVQYEKSTGDAVEGDIIRIDVSSRRWFTDGAYYIVINVDEDGDPEVYDDDGDDMPVHDGAEFTVFKPVKSDRPKVGDYVKVVDDRDIHGNKRSDVTVGEIRKIVKDDRSGIPYRAELLDGSERNWFRAETLVRATDEEVAAAKAELADKQRKQFATGDKVRLVSGGNTDGLSGFEDGKIYEVGQTDGKPGGWPDGRVQIKCTRGFSGCAKPEQLEKVTEDDPESLVGAYVKVIANKRSHNYEMGSVIKLVSWNADADGYEAERHDGTVGNFIRKSLREFELSTKEAFEAQRRLKVGEYARVVGNSNSHNCAIGSVVKITWVSEYRSIGGHSYIGETADGTISNYLWESDLKRVSAEEAEAARKLQVSVGDYVRITGKHTPNAGGPHNYDVGDIVKVREVLEDSVRCIRESDGSRQRISPINFEIISGAETEEIAKWAKIGREVGAFKRGDFIAIDDGRLGTVEDVGADILGVRFSVKIYDREASYNAVSKSRATLIVPAEQRFDKSA